MEMKNKAIIDNRVLKTFGMAFLLILLSSFVYPIEGCKEKVMTQDDIPCYLLLQFNETSLNCATKTVTIYRGNTTIYSIPMSNHSPNFMCSAINNQSALGTYTAQYSTGDTADWVVEGGTKMIWLLYLTIAFFLALFLISLWKEDANLGAISGIGFLCVGLFMFTLVKGAIVVSGLTLESNLLTESISIILLGFGMFIWGNAWEEWFKMFG
jgi:hypothetical protein